MQLAQTRPPDFYSQPEMVAEVIFEAATDGKDTLRYIAGDDAKQLIGIKEQQGDDAFFAVIKQMFSPQ